MCRRLTWGLLRQGWEIARLFLGFYGDWSVFLLVECYKYLLKQKILYFKQIQLLNQIDIDKKLSFERSTAMGTCYPISAVVTELYSDQIMVPIAI